MKEGKKGDPRLELSSRKESITIVTFLNLLYIVRSYINLSFSLTFLTPLGVTSHPEKNPHRKLPVAAPKIQVFKLTGYPVFFN